MMIHHHHLRHTRKLLFAGRGYFGEELLLPLQIGKENGDLGSGLDYAGVVLPQHGFHLVGDGGDLRLHERQILLLLL